MQIQTLKYSHLLKLRMMSGRWFLRDRALCKLQPLDQIRWQLLEDGVVLKEEKLLLLIHLSKCHCNQMLVVVDFSV